MHGTNRSNSKDFTRRKVLIIEHTKSLIKHYLSYSVIIDNNIKAVLFFLFLCQSTVAWFFVNTNCLVNCKSTIFVSSFLQIVRSLCHSELVIELNNFKRNDGKQILFRIEIMAEKEESAN